MENEKLIEEAKQWRIAPDVSNGIPHWVSLNKGRGAMLPFAFVHEDEAEMIVQLATALAAATTENTQLRSAINRAGFGVMKTSGDWLICDVSKAGEAEREKTAEIIIRNIELEKEIAAATERELGMREAMSGAVRMLHAAGYKMEGTISDKIRESFPELFTKDNK